MILSNGIPAVTNSGCISHQRADRMWTANDRALVVSRRNFWGVFVRCRHGCVSAPPQSSSIASRASSRAAATAAGRAAGVSGTGTECLLTCMGLFLSSSFFGYYQFLVRSEETRSSPRRLRSGSLERAEGGQGTETLAELGDLLLCVACVWQRLDA